MATLTEQARTAQWLKWMTNRGYCLAERTIEADAVGGAAAALYTGDVLRLGTGVKLIAVSATTGADAVAVLLEDVTAAENAADVTRLVLVRGPAVIDSDNLVFTESDTQKAAAITALAALDIRVTEAGSATWTTQTT